eukprot:gene4262-5332_t
MDLVHGWLVDPQDIELTSIIGDMTYNKLTEKLVSPTTNQQSQQNTNNNNNNFNHNNNFNFDLEIPSSSSSTTTTTTTTNTNSKSTANSSSSKYNNNNNHSYYNNNNNNNSFDFDDPAESFSSGMSISSGGETTTDHLYIELRIKQFLKDTSSQLSYHGLYELHSNLKEDEFVVFFRNNHFNTLLKHNSELYLLITDEGYINEPVIWEKLSQIDGDTDLVQSDFTKYKKEDLYSDFNQGGGNGGSVNPTEFMTDEEYARYLSQQQSVPQNTDQDFQIALQLHHRENEKNGYRQKSKRSDKEKEKPKEKDKSDKGKDKKSNCKTQ